VSALIARYSVVSEGVTGLTQPPYGQQPSGPYPQNQQQPYQQPPNQPPYQYGPPSMAPQQGQGLGWGPQFAPPPPPGPPGYPPPPGGFPPGPGFQPGWQQQLPPRKKSKAPLFAILGVVLVGVVGLWIFGVIKKNADNNYTQPTSTQPTYRSTEGPIPTEEPTEEPSATGPTTNRPKTTRPTRTATSKPTAPPPSDLDIVAKNRLYKTGQMRTVGCKEPNIRPNTAANAAKYWARIKPCLDRSWARQIALSGYQFRAPSMLYWAGTSVSNPCGSGAVDVPFYCSSNHMMYMKVDNFVKVYNRYPDAENKAYARMWYSRSIAHEYGHAMQSLTGILEASYDLEYEMTSSDDRRRQTRRMELQANCFAGVFLAANKRSYPINGMMLHVWNKWVVTSGDKPEEGDHGSVASQGRFMGRAFLTANPASCNTFAASPRNVS
jgi:predicted metalloprotease